MRNRYIYIIQIFLIVYMGTIFFLNTDRLKYWEVMSEGGDKFAVENPPHGSDNIPIKARLDCIESCLFATSYYHSCSKQQKITLAELGISAFIMDRYKPTISFTDVKLNVHYIF